MHLLVVANETVTGRKLIEAVERRKEAGDLQVTVLAPVSQPTRGYVVYEDTRRAAAGRRLDRTLTLLRDEGIPAHGFVVESDPVTAVRDALAQLEPPVDEIILATHPQQKSGWLRKNVVDRIRETAGSVPVEHVVVDLTAETGAKNVLVLANETVVGKALLDRIRERNARGDASFLIISPQSDPTQAEHPEAERRLKRALAELRSEGIDAHGQIAQPDPFSAALDAVQEERVDEIIVSTFAPSRSPWLRKNLVQRLHDETKLPVEHIVFQSDQVEEGARRLVSAHAEAHHGPPIANQSSRVNASILGMLLFIASEIMLFGAFFTAYFFVRVVNGIEWPQPPFELPVFVAGVNTAILVTSSFTMHWALQSIKRGNRAGLQAGLLLTFLMGLVFLVTQAREYSRVGFAPHNGAFGTIFYCLTGLHGAHVFVGLSILLFMTIRAFRGHFSPEHHHGVEIGGIYWHFVDVMWIVVYSTVYLL